MHRNGLKGHQHIAQGIALGRRTIVKFALKGHKPYRASLCFCPCRAPLLRFALTQDDALGWELYGLPGRPAELPKLKLTWARRKWKPTAYHVLNKHKVTKTLSNFSWRKDTKVLAWESLCLQFSGVALRAFVSLCLIVFWFFIVDLVELKLPPAPETWRRTHVNYHCCPWKSNKSVKSFPKQSPFSSHAFGGAYFDIKYGSFPLFCDMILSFFGTKQISLTKIFWFAYTFLHYPLYSVVVQVVKSCIEL